MLRNVCKTPYRVLDTPELAEDFYLTASTSGPPATLPSTASAIFQIATTQLRFLGPKGLDRTISGRLHVYDADNDNDEPPKKKPAAQTKPRPSKSKKDEDSL
ncbi:hypothetical protein B0H11DRAFT_1050420 [Mycena galericulata]|nr:hypothetical protein B0H11DRAFT_1050420 [Mycena galericulata]